MNQQTSPNYTYENLTQSGLFRINSKDDRNVSLSLDAFGGSTSFCVFTGAGGRPWKYSLNGKAKALIIVMLEKMAAAPSPQRQPVMLNKFEENDGKKRFVEYGQIGFGIDENLMLFIDVAANDLQGRHLFQIKPDPKANFTNTTMSEKDILVGLINWLIGELRITSTLAERMTSFKRAPGGGFGGNRGASAGGGNRGGSSYSGGNAGGGSGGGGYNNNNNNNTQQRQSSGTFSGPDVENDLHL